MRALNAGLIGLFVVVALALFDHGRLCVRDRDYSDAMQALAASACSFALAAFALMTRLCP